MSAGYAIFKPVNLLNTMIFMRLAHDPCGDPEGVKNPLDNDKASLLAFSVRPPVPASETALSELWTWESPSPPTETLSVSAHVT